MEKKKIAVLGSTGSIGTQTLSVIRSHPGEFEATTLTAGNNAELLIEQAREFVPDSVVIANAALYDEISEALADLPIKVYAGSEAVSQVVENDDIDIVLVALVGFSGLRPTINAIRARKTIALANKETLVVAGAYVTRCAEENNVLILPVDSEHSAIFQCLVGETFNPIEKILLTASGGPFRSFTTEQLAHVTAEQALKHPNWAMGAKITIDSATMMNKGFEMMEARWLFGVSPADIEVVVHPESIVHSAVQFADGAVKAQLGTPDMRIPIQYALTFPQRLEADTKRIDLFALRALHFEEADRKRFPCLQLAYDAAEVGGNIPCALNAANEVANKAFRDGRIAFNDIPAIIAKTVERTPFDACTDVEAYFTTDAAARRIAAEYI